MATPTPTPTSPPQLSYTPSTSEQPYYDILWEEADRSRCGSIAGGEAVSFLSRSKLPITLLKNIWLMADNNPRTNSLNKSKFYISIRLIQLYQNGQKAQGIDLKSENEMALRAPYFEGIVVPSSQQNLNVVQHQQSGQQYVTAPVVNQSQPQPNIIQYQSETANITALTPAHDAYYMSPSDQSRYETLFPTYDMKKDGFVYGAEAVSLFSRSGLSNEQLRDIWNISDDPVDNRLSKLEFCIAMHMIVCVSRKNLPLPDRLPLSLASLKNVQAAPPIQTQISPLPVASFYAQPQYNVPAIPTDSSSHIHAQPQYALPTDAASIASSTHTQPQYFASSEVVAPPSPAPSTDTNASHNMAAFQRGKPPLAPTTSKMSITDAFSNIPNEPQQQQNAYSVSNTTAVPPSSSNHQAENHNTNSSAREASTSEQQQLHKSPPALPLSSEPATTSNDTNQQQTNNDDEELTNLQQILQQMRAENISLKAQLSTYSSDETLVKEEITRTIDEIALLSKELSSLRAQVTQANVSLVEATSQLVIYQEKKSALQDVISNEQSTLRALEDSSNAVQGVSQQIQISNVNSNKYTNYEVVDLLRFSETPPKFPPPLPPSENLAPPEPNQPKQHQQQQISNSVEYSQQVQPSAYEHQPQPQQPEQQQQAQPMQQQQQSPPVQQQEYQQPQPPVQQPEYQQQLPPQPTQQEYQQQQQQPQQTYQNEQHSENNTASSTIDSQQLENLEILKSDAIKARSEAEEAKSEYSRVKIKSEQLKLDAEEAQKEYATLQSTVETTKKKIFSSKKKSKSILEKTQKEADTLSKKYFEAKNHVEDAMANVTVTQKRADDLMSAVESKELEIATAESCKVNGNGNHHYAF